MATQSNRLQWPDHMPELLGPWLGQQLPAGEAMEFCPAVLGHGVQVAGITFDPSGEEALLAWNTPDGESAHLMRTAMGDGCWIKPEPAPFNSTEIDNDVCMAPDGKRVVWRSWRPLPGNMKPEDDVSLWAVDRTPGGWGEPFPVECAGRRQPAVYPGIGLSGALYFSVRTSDGSCVVARARRDGTQYNAREIIIPETSPGGDLCVAPDESFLVITVYSGEPGARRGNLHVSFQHEDGEWTPLQDLGPAINSELTEYCPTISADGKWLFFCRLDRTDPHAPIRRTYWISTDVIRRFRP